MKTNVFLFLHLFFLLSGCESISTSAPPLTAQLVRAGASEHADARVLQEGRTLFLNRCIQCHALPAIQKYSAERVRGILRTMSGRANLSGPQHDAVLKYLLAVRSL
ncbi:MAG: hypothetical protein ABJB09_02735 [Verrucomicrobiota bacterium]